MMGILALVWPAMGWIYVIADNARASTNDQNIKIEREIERTNAVKGDIADIKETIKDVNSELKAMRKEQAGFFRGIAK
jgi:predicted site-specific integrase-resolvase